VDEDLSRGTDCPGCFESHSIRHRKGAGLRGCPGGDGWYLSLRMGGHSDCDDRRREWMIPHQKDEWVSVEELELTARIYAASALEFLNG